MSAALVLLIPGLYGAVLAALLGQLQMLWDCCDGEVARWRQTTSPKGVFIDRVGHYTTEGLIPIALGLRAAGFPGEGWLDTPWPLVGALVSVLVLYNKALNDMVHVSRAYNNMPRLEEKAEVAAPRSTGLRRVRSLARFVPFHRAYHSVELTLLALVAAVGDVALGDLGATRFLVAFLAVFGVVTVVGPSGVDPVLEPAALADGRAAEPGPVPHYAVVVLTMGKRPDDLDRGLRSILAQQGVTTDVVVVGNAWEPVGLPDGVRAHGLPENLGIPAGRNAGVPLVDGDLLLFLDDDASLPDPHFLRTVADRFAADPRPRPHPAPRGRPDRAAGTAQRWVPRLRVGDPLASSPATALWEGAVVMRRSLFEAIGGWPDEFFYAHEGIDLVWRVWDEGYMPWYAADLVANHPVIDPARHDVYYRLNARNRVWLARRNLPVRPGAGLRRHLGRHDPAARARPGGARRLVRRPARGHCGSGRRAGGG